MDAYYFWKFCYPVRLLKRSEYFLTLKLLYDLYHGVVMQYVVNLDEVHFLLNFQLQTHEPDLWTHFVSNDIQPLRLVFRWMMRGFSGHLPPEQVC